jgi:hypothetical protein
MLKVVSASMKDALWISIYELPSLSEKSRCERSYFNHGQY